MMNFEFMERITSTETYEWIGLLPTPVLREFLHPYILNFRRKPKDRQGLQKRIEYANKIRDVDPSAFVEYSIPKSVDKIPTDVLHRLAPVLARVDDHIRLEVRSLGIVEQWAHDPYALQLVRLKNVRDDYGNQVFGVSLGRVSASEVEVTWLHGSPRFYGVAKSKDLKVIRPLWPWIGCRNADGIPVLYTIVRSPQGFLAAFCPVCATFHMHGAGVGLRVAHCVPSHWDTYELDEPEYSIGQITRPIEGFSRKAREAVEEFLSHIEVHSNER
ncbi:hypothetical protein [Alicyclobacillus sendaiensis]|uniref:hypothetical protein n=1 Tax=Alicyclobacillus sendaiensis TaxID=192387 RepID=UPI0026F462B0|nr:hypothetical protein [Alicyclobacillus sendaiensis]